MACPTSMWSRAQAAVAVLLARAVTSEAHRHSPPSRCRLECCGAGDRAQQSLLASQRVLSAVTPHRARP